MPHTKPYLERLSKEELVSGYQELETRLCKIQDEREILRDRYFTLEGKYITVREKYLALLEEKLSAIDTALQSVSKG